MSVIAVMSDSGFFTTCANVTPLSGLPGSAGGKYEFEVLAEEASSLEGRLNKPDVYQIEEETVTATLSLLEPSRPVEKESNPSPQAARLHGVLTVETNLERTSYLDNLLYTDCLN